MEKQLKKEEPVVCDYKNRAAQLYLYDFLEEMPEGLESRGTLTKMRVPGVHDNIH